MSMLNKRQHSVEQDDLIKTFLNLERIDDNIFRSTHLLPGKKEGDRVYGGQVVGQALMAATRTVPPTFHPHSLHCYFIYAGDKDKALIYDVSRVRDGRSFCTRFVKTIQGGRTIFTASISFQVIEPDSIVHQAPMPDVPPPEECEDAVSFRNRVINEPDTISEGGRLALSAYRQVLDLPDVFALKMITPRAYIQMPSDRPMKFACWVKSNAPIGDEEHLHQCVAAFVSDIAPVGTPIGAHAAAGFRLGMAASLDHSMWIHRHDFRMDDDWLLYETESTIAASSRALIQGKMWTRSGRMVLSTSQEIIVRGQRSSNENDEKNSRAD